MKKIIPLALCACLAMSSAAPYASYASTVGSASSPASSKAAATEEYLQGLDPTERMIATAVHSAYVEIAPSLKAECARLAEAEIRSVGKTALAEFEKNKAEFDRITYYQPDLDMLISSISMYKDLNIPPQFLSSAVSQAQSSVESMMSDQFAAVAAMVDAAIDENLTSLSPKVVASVKPQIKDIIYNVGDLIDTRLSATIEEQIMKIMPEIMDKLPPEDQELTPEEFAIKYMEKVEPAAQAALRPAMEDEIKAEITKLTDEYVELPINEFMTPKYMMIETKSYDGTVDQIPDWAFKFVSRDFVKGVVSAETAKLRDGLPLRIEAHQAKMSKRVRAEIDKFIDDTVKVYVNGKLSSAKLKLRNGEYFMKWQDVARSFGVNVKYDKVRKIITIVKAKTTIKLTHGNDDVVINGRKVRDYIKETGVPVSSSGAPIVPVDTLAKVMGYEFDRNDDWNMMTLEPHAKPAVSSN